MNRLVLLPLLLSWFSLLTRAQSPISTVGEQRLIVIMVAINSTPDPAWIAQGQEAFFGTSPTSLDQTYRALSGGRVWFTGQTVGVSVSGTQGSCDFSFAPGSTMDKIDAAVRALGVALDSYPRRAYSMPGYCSSADRGYPWLTVNDVDFSAIFLTLGNGLGNIAHEMGHAFGLTHAGTWNPDSDRGDIGDFMGGGALIVNAPHKEQLKWWESYMIQLVTQSGTYIIQHQLRSTSGIMALKIPKPDTADFWYVGYQQDLPLNWTSIYPTITGGASIHTRRADHVSTQLVDTQPSGGLAFLDAPLVDGRTFYDSTNRISIQQLSHTSTSVAVLVTFSATAPTPPPPPPPPPSKCPPGTKPVGNSGKCK